MSDICQAPRFEPTGVLGEYLVTIEAWPVGRVRKHTTNYNLRRPVTVHDWIATTLDGEMSSGGWRTRADAAQALIDLDAKKHPRP